MLRHFSQALIISLSLFFPAVVNAATVSENEALELATEFFSSSGVSRLSAPGSLELAFTAKDKQKPLYYVFNSTDGQGFIIVSADDCTAPVLGYSTESHYSPASVPAAMKWMISGLENEIRIAPDVQRPQSVKARREAIRRVAQSSGRILLPTAQWSQEGPFNNAIPGHPLVGCVGTAMGIVMKYHKWPERGVGSHNNVNFDVKYEWDDMRTDNYRSSYTQAQADAVATLLYHTAVSVGTQFGMSGSSAYEVRVPAAMTNYFGYDPGISYKKRSETPDQAAFDAIIKEEISKSRPVIFCGQDVTAGHAFVVDGFDPVTNMLHINWGWGGQDGNNNGGWYVSTALNPTVSVSHSFNNLATIIYNIKPGTGDNSNWSPIHITADGSQIGMGSDVTDLAAGKTFTVRVGNLKNVSYSDFTGKMAVALFDAAGKFKTLLSAEQGLSLKGMAYLFNGFATFGSCKLPSGANTAQDDVIRIATSIDGGATWLPVPGELLTVNEIPASRMSPDCFSISLPSSTEVSVTGESTVIRGWDYKFKVVPSDPAQQIVTVKANGYVVTPREGTCDYTLSNVRADQEITILVQAASEVKAKRSVWVSEPGTLRTLLSEADAAAVKDLTLFGSINATDFEFMRSGMRLTRLDISSAYIAASGSDQAYALPRNAFQGQGQLTEVILPNNLNRINNGAFRSCGITSITIPAGVKTYEYNVFLGASKLRDIWVGRETAEFINWCVLSGTNKGAMTLHVPTQAAVNNYSNKDNWKEIGSIMVDPIPAVNDCLFAVADNADVKFDCDDSRKIPSRYTKGTIFRFKASHIADNDDRMEVYANNALLSPDANGTYTVTLNGNTLVHFDLIKPVQVSQYPSEMQLTNTGGTVGLLTDAVNVFEGVPFTIRANAFKVPADMGSFFWAAVLTDAQGNIKEFISPVATWPSSTTGDGLKMNVNCCVSKATVRDGNKICLATSYNNKTWALVKGASQDVTDALDARNNQTPVYNITFPELKNANVSGVVATAVHGRDITINVSPKNARDRINMSVNGEIYATDATSVQYSFIAKEDMTFDVEVKSPPVPDVKTYTVTKTGTLTELIQDANAGRLPEKVVITGETTRSKLSQAFINYPAVRNKVKSLDISNLRVYDMESSTVEILGEFMFGNASKKNGTLKELILPSTVTTLGNNALSYCTALTEITLPASLEYNPYNSQYALGKSVLEGSTNITTIYIPGDLKEYYKITYACHYNPNCQSVKSYKLFNTAGIEPEVTVVVPEKWLPYYKDKTGDYTNNKTTNWYGWDHYRYGNPWLLDGYNILSENPVYSLNFDPARLKAAEGFDFNNINFLRKNVTLETISTEGKLFLTADPATNVRVFDNGKVMPASAIGEDRSVNVVFHNPRFETGLQGNHDIRVRYYHKINFDLSSELFEVTPAEVRNDGQNTFETWNTAVAVAPVLTDVEENSTVRFKVGMKDSNPDIIAKVKTGELVLTPDEEGYYSIDVTDTDLHVGIYAVPTNGATISEEEFKSIDVHEATEVVTLSLTGDIAGETLAGVMEGFSSLEELDLSQMTSGLPEEAFKGAVGLKVVTLPNIGTIPTGAFTGCSSLTTVTVPECVNEIGSNAFSGCASLESVTLSGINGIGANAFSGCDNLRCIYINAGVSGDARKAPRATRALTDYSEKAFEGLNPNCIIVLGENVTRPSAPGNYISTTTGLIKDVDAEGNTIEREGRIYTSTGSISLQSGQSFETPYKFTLADGERITLSVPVGAFSSNGGWTSLVTPFDTEIPQGFEVAGVNEEDGFVKTTVIKAYIPYLIRRTAEGEASDIVLTGNEGTVINATPENMETNGKDFMLVATMKSQSLDGTQTYRLNADGSAFEHTAYNDEIATFAESETDENPVPVVDVTPFEVYAKSGNAGAEIPISFEDFTTSIPGIISADGNFKIYRNRDSLVVESVIDTDLPVYDSAGRLCRKLGIKAGTNTISGLEPGQMYVIGNIKVMF